MRADLSVVSFLLVVFFFFCKQKTAYEMRISDWSSDVCSSDLRRTGTVLGPRRKLLDRQSAASGAEHPADRLLGLVPEHSLPLSLSGDRGVDLPRLLQPQQQRVRRLPDAGVRRGRLSVALLQFLAEIGRAHV